MDRYLIQNASLVPVVRDYEVFLSDVLIEKGRISKIAPRIVAEQGVEVIQAQDCFVLPGFIQGHIHLIQTLLRHQADDLELLDWLKNRVWPYEAALDEESAYASAELGLSELISGGTTTICDFGTTHSHQYVMEAVKKSGIRYIGGKTQMDMGEGVPQRLLEKTDKSLQEIEDLGKKWHGACGGRIQYAVTPRFAVSCTEVLLQESAKLARQNHWYLQTHTSENKGEIELVKKITGLQNIHFLHKMGFTGEDTILAHGVHVDSQEMDVLQKTKTRICHCPGSNLKLASGIANIPEMLRRGIPVMLGADGAPCNNRLSIFYEMTLAATIHKVRHGPLTMPAWQVLRMATVEAAKALRLEKEIGTLEVGKKADLVILKRNSLSLYPDGDIASQIVFGAHPQDVHYVFVDGNILLQKGELQVFHQGKIKENSLRAWNQTKKSMKFYQ